MTKEIKLGDRVLVAQMVLIPGGLFAPIRSIPISRREGVINEISSKGNIKVGEEWLQPGEKIEEVLND